MDKNHESYKEDRFLRDLIRYSDKLKEYATKSTGIDGDIARRLAREIYSSVKKNDIEGLYNITGFVYGLLFGYDDFHELFLIVSDIMKLIRRLSNEG